MMMSQVRPTGFYQGDSLAAVDLKRAHRMLRIQRMGQHDASNKVEEA